MDSVRDLCVGARLLAASMKTRAFFVVVILLFGWFFIVEKGERKSDALIASKSVEGGKEADSTVANPGVNWTKEGKGEQNLRKGRLEAKQRDQSHNPGWAVPFGAEFWRKRDFDASGMKGVWLTKAPHLRGDSAAVQEAIERVTHAFQRDARIAEHHQQSINSRASSANKRCEIPGALCGTEAGDQRG